MNTLPSEFFQAKSQAFKGEWVSPWATPTPCKASHQPPAWCSLLLNNLTSLLLLFPSASASSWKGGLKNCFHFPSAYNYTSSLPALSRHTTYCCAGIKSTQAWASLFFPILKTSAQNLSLPVLSLGRRGSPPTFQGQNELRFVPCTHVRINKFSFSLKKLEIVLLSPPLLLSIIPSFIRSIPVTDLGAWNSSLFQSSKLVANFLNFFTFISQASLLNSLQVD